MHMASVIHRQQHATPFYRSSSGPLRHGGLLGFHAPKAKHHSVVSRVATPKLASTGDNRRDVNAIEGPSTDLSVIYGRLQRVRYQVIPLLPCNPHQCCITFVCFVLSIAIIGNHLPAAAGVALLD